MAWEYRIHRFPKRGYLQKEQLAAQNVLDDYGHLGWELVSVSDSEAIAVFKRRAMPRDADLEPMKLSLASELRELTAAIEELNR
jgi:hypothetical protein